MTMVVEAWQNYINMISGVTKATRSKALTTARGVLAQAGLEDVAVDAGDRVTKLAEEIFSASRANRELMEKVVGSEIEKAAAKWGFVRTEQLEEVRDELAELRLSLAHQAAHPQPDLDTSPPPVKNAPVKKAPAKKAAPVKKAAPAKKAAVKQAAPAKKASVKKAAPAKKTAAKKTAPRAASRSTGSSSD